LFAAAGGFVAASFVVPVGRSGGASQGPVDIAQQLGAAEAAVKTLEEEKILDQPRAAELRQNLDELHNQADHGADPSRLFESLDHLKQALKQLGDTAADQMVRSIQQLAQAQALAEAIEVDQSSARPALEGQALADSMALLDQLMKQAATENQSMRQQIEAGNLSPAQAGRAAAGVIQDELDRMRHLANQNLIDPRKLAEGQAAGQCNSQGLADFLARNPGLGSAQSQMEAWTKQGGRGGVNRGRGDAELTWGEPAGDEGAKFKETVLPPAARSSDESTKVGVSVVAPTVETPTGPSIGGAIGSAQAGDGSASRAAILPQHRSAVRGYFNAAPSPAPPPAKP
jgi:hypothetical protein